MNNKKVIIFGTGQIAEVAYFYLKNDSEYEVTGFTVNKEFMQQKSFFDLPIVPFEEIQNVFTPDVYYLFIPIGYTKMNALREEKYIEGKKKGYKFATYISSKATYYGTQVGENCFIFENNVIQPYSKIGNNVILWSGNHLGHHSCIEDHVFVTSHVVISGSVKVGSNSFLGVNSTIRDNIEIGKRNLIGAGAVILKSTNDDEVYTQRHTSLIPKKSFEIEKI